MRNGNNDKNRASKRIKSVSFCRFLAYNSSRDKFIMTIGTIGAVLAGLLLPSISLVMGEVSQAFGPDNSGENTLETMTTVAKWLVCIAIVIFICGYCFFAFW